MTTDPIVESVWVVPGADGTGQVQSSEARDEVWMIVKRTINGSTKRYVEVLERDFEHGHDQEDAYYADSLITYDQPLDVTNIAVTAASTAYSTGAVHFDTLTRLDLASLTAADSPFLSESLWFRYELDGTNPRAFDLWQVGAVDSDGQFINYGNGTTQFGAFVTNIASGAFLDGLVTAGGTPITPAVWHNALMTFQTNLAAGAKIVQLYIDDVNVLNNSDDGGSASFDISFSGRAFSVGGFPLAENGVGDMADFWFAPGQFIDFSVTANRRKFISATGKPVDLGADGSTPTGTAPAVFLRRAASAAASTFATDLSGHGNTLTITGALTAASSSPSD